ncbi:MAG: hypothetical protein AAB932_06450 [Patescibacteria group bacterium]
MNYKRAAGFGIMLWILIFVAFSIIMFLPPLKDNELGQYIALWVALAPITLFLAKWYFLKEHPSIRSGFLLGIAGIAVATLLDLAITIPLFVGAEAPYREALGVFYSNAKLYVGLAEVLILCILAGGEYDRMNWKKGSS